MKITSRKHWITYFGYFILLFIGILFIGNFSMLKNDSGYWKYFHLIIGTWIIFKSLKGSILNYCTTWSFENNILTVKDGFLPWKRTNFSTDRTQIFEALYSSSFLGTIFGYGTINIRRTDGITSQLIETSMSKQKQFVSSINNAIEDLKSINTSDSTVQDGLSIPDELRKLADLNKDGIISDYEFENLKNKIIK